MNPDNSTQGVTLKNVQATAQKVAVTVLSVNARTPREIENAFSVMARERTGAVIVFADQYFREQRFQIAALAMQRHVDLPLPAPSPQKKPPTARGCESLPEELPRLRTPPRRQARGAANGHQRDAETTAHPRSEPVPTMVVRCRAVALSRKFHANLI